MLEMPWTCLGPLGYELLVHVYFMSGLSLSSGRALTHHYLDQLLSSENRLLEDAHGNVQQPLASETVINEPQYVQQVPA